MGKVHIKYPSGKIGEERNIGDFIMINKENFWRRVNSDGTLTKVEDGNNGTYDYRNPSVPKKVRNNTAWRLSLASTINPTSSYPEEIQSKLAMYKVAKKKQKSDDVTKQSYDIRPAIGDSVANAAWRKYLGLSYDEKFLPIGVPDDRTYYGTNTVRLPKQLEAEIPVDTTLLKNRIARNEAYLNNGQPKPDDNIRATKIAIELDNKALDNLRYTYNTGNPTGMEETTYNSRQLINEGVFNTDGINFTPLNVLQKYNIRYDKDTNRMYYSDEYDFDNFNVWPLNWFGGIDRFLGGKPFRIRGYIDLNKKKNPAQ